MAENRPCRTANHGHRAPDLPRFARGTSAMNLRQWWLDHKDGLTTNRTTWTAMRARCWPRVKETSLDAWRRSAQAREWTSKHPNLAIAPAVIVAILSQVG